MIGNGNKGWKGKPGCNKSWCYFEFFQYEKSIHHKAVLLNKPTSDPYGSPPRVLERAPTLLRLPNPLCLGCLWWRSRTCLRVSWVLFELHQTRTPSFSFFFVGCGWLVGLRVRYRQCPCLSSLHLYNIFFYFTSTTPLVLLFFFFFPGSGVSIWRLPRPISRRGRRSAGLECKWLKWRRRAMRQLQRLDRIPWIIEQSTPFVCFKS